MAGESARPTSVTIFSLQADQVCGLVTCDKDRWGSGCGLSLAARYYKISEKGENMATREQLLIAATWGMDKKGLQALVKSDWAVYRQAVERLIALVHKK